VGSSSPVSNNRRTLALTLSSEAPLLADGRDKRKVSVAVPADTGFGKTLTATTSLGYINPAATGDARKTLNLSTSGEAALEFTLFAETTAGTGILTLTGPSGLSASPKGFSIVNLTGTLDLAVPSSVVADGNPVELQIQLHSDNDDERQVVITTTSGVISPAASGDAKLTTTVTVKPETPQTLNWLPTSTGTTGITAGFVGVGPAATALVNVVAPSPTVSIDVQGGPFVADGSTQVPVTVSLGSGTGTQVVKLITNIGVLDPSAASGSAVSFEIAAGKSKIVPLLVGRQPGRVNLSASIKDSVVAASTFDLGYAAPNLLGLTISPSAVFSNKTASGTVLATFGRNSGLGDVSVGTRVRFMVCCDSGDGFGSCSNYLSIPSFAIDSTGQGSVSTTLQLTPAGLAWVAQSVTAAVTLDAKLFAFVSTAASTVVPTCAALNSSTASSDVVLTSLLIALQRPTT